MVDGVVAVGGRGEDRCQQEAVGAQFDDVVQPCRQLWQPVVNLIDSCALGADESQREDVPPDDAARPVHDDSLHASVTSLARSSLALGLIEC